MIEDEVKVKGEVELLVHNRDGVLIDQIKFPNAVLKKGREALAATVCNRIGGNFELFINRMLFGDGGTNSDTPKIVDAARNGLFGVTRVSKPVSVVIDSTNRYQVTFTSVISFDDGNGYTLNEMALQLATGDFFSMATFGGIAKTSGMQLTWLWTISFL
jgi:hypothetical protein